MYLLTNDSIRTYLNGLGARKVEVVDGSALVSKRTTLLKDLTDVQSEILMLQNELAEIDEDESILSKERGGDSHLLSLQHPITSDSVESTTTLFIPSMFPYKKNDSLTTKDNNEKSKVDVAKYFRSSGFIVDAEVFLDSRALQPAGTSRNIYGRYQCYSFLNYITKLGDNFRKALWTCWMKVSYYIFFIFYFLLFY